MDFRIEVEVKRGQVTEVKVAGPPVTATVIEAALGLARGLVHTQVLVGMVIEELERRRQVRVASAEDMERLANGSRGGAPI